MKNSLKQFWGFQCTFHEPLWQVLQVAQDKHFYHVDPYIWSKNRGIMTAEQIVSDLVGLLTES